MATPFSWPSAGMCPGNSLPQRFSPGLDFRQDLRSRAGVPVDHAGAEPVFLQHVVGRDDELEVPRGIVALELGVLARSVRGVGEADVLALIEHEDEDLPAE